MRTPKWFKRGQKRKTKTSHAPIAKVVHVKSKNAPRIDDDKHQALRSAGPGEYLKTPRERAEA